MTSRIQSITVVILANMVVSPHLPMTPSLDTVLVTPMRVCWSPSL